MTLDDEKTIPDGWTLDGDGLPELRKALLIYHRDGLDVVGLDPDQPVVVGRSEPSDIVARSRRLSRQHARFELREGVVRVLDLESTNGTWLNGRRIDREEPVHEEDEVTLGSVAITVQTLGEVEGRLSGLLPHERFLQAVDQRLQRLSGSRGVGLVVVRALGGRGRLSRWVPRVRDLLSLEDQVGLYGPDAVEILLADADPERVRRVIRDIIEGRGPEEPELICGAAHQVGASAGAELLVERARRDLGASRTRGLTIQELPDGDGPVVKDPAMVALFRDLERVARSVLTVLVLGETGSGKEVVARSLHESSGRRGPLRSINCGAIPAQLLESALFGHEKGAFTGADRQRKGVFEEADGGTVFLDEIGELSPGAQVALLRVLETRRIQRVGSSQEIPVDVRIVAATHRDLEAMCEEGTFRWDLLYRLNSITLTLPPLRERLGEIEPLVLRFVQLANRENDRAVTSVSPSAMECLRQHSWPGNVRELRNAVERAVVVATGDEITVDDLPERIRMNASRGDDLRRTPEPTEEYVARPRVWLKQHDLKERLALFERELIHSALRACDGNQTEASQALGIPRRTLVYKIRSYGITAPDPTAPPLVPAFDATGAPLDFRGRVEQLEVQLIHEAMAQAHGDRAVAARLLGIQRRTLESKLRRAPWEPDRR